MYQAAAGRSIQPGCGETETCWKVKLTTLYELSSPHECVVALCSSVEGRSPYPWGSQSFHALCLDSSQVHTLAETAGFPGFKDQKVSYTSHDPHRYGDFRLFPTEMKVSLAACCCPASWLLLSDFTALSGIIDAFTDSLSRGLARHSTNKSVAEIHVTSGLRHLYCLHLSSFFLTLDQVFMPLDLSSFAVTSTQIEMGPI